MSAFRSWACDETPSFGNTRYRGEPIVRGGEEHAGADLAVGQARGCQLGDLQLPGRQLVEAGAGGRARRGGAGGVAAVLARRDEHLGVRVEVAGDAPTPAEMAAALGVPLVPVPLEDVRRRSADLGAMYAFLSGEGYGIDVAALRARYPEVAWRSFADWVAARR